MMAELDLLNGFAGKVISDCIDITINAIKKADKNRKAENQTIETRIYQVTIDALNAFPYNKYKQEEQVYDAAESILKELKRENINYKESVRAGLNMLSSEITEDICEDFLKLLCDEMYKEKNRDLAVGYIIYRGEQVIHLQKETNKYVQQGFEKSYQKEEEILREINSIKEDKKEKNNGVFVENKAQYYADKWDKNVFLNNFDEEDERIDDKVNVKLKDIYLEELLPSYILNENNNPSYNLRIRLEKYIVNRNNREMLLILGQPGIGKSTLVTWIMANLVKKKDEIFVYQFASDLKKVNWQGDSLLKEILLTLHLKYEELRNKVLILDGFDEIRIYGNREGILNRLYQELERMNYLGRFSLIITCRENYVNCKHLLIKTYITLQAWNEYQIKVFCDIYKKRSTNNLEANIQDIKIHKILEKKEIFGIPLILYMILALDVKIEKNSSIVDVYDQIFSLEGGVIYDRCYDVAHRTNSPKIKKHIHQISQKIAFWIFENRADEAVIPQEKFEEICENEINESEEKDKEIKSDTLIGNFFRLMHCEGEGADELQFVHRSIYEYFVAVFFYESIYKLTSKKEVAGKLGILLMKGELTKYILEYIQYKFDNAHINGLSHIIKEVFQIMLRDGMTYHTGVPCKNAINREMKIFIDMLNIVGLWNSNLGEVDDGIIIYLQCNCNRMYSLNLKGMKLNGADLRGVDLSGADLSGADLSKTDLREADLSGTDLSGANLREVKLKGANLRGAYLKGAYLSEVDLEGAQCGNADLRGAYLGKANLKKAYLGGAILDSSQVGLLSLLPENYDLSNSVIHILETGEIVSYREYCTKKLSDIELSSRKD